MTRFYPTIIDAYSHCLPPKYRQALYKHVPAGSYFLHTKNNPSFDLDNLFRAMDHFEGLVMVLTLNSPPPEQIGGPKVALDFARMANDEIAELCAKYPERFITGMANLPMNNVNGALKELDRCIKDLNFRGAQIYTPVNDKPLDSPEFLPFFEKMSQYNLPIYLHPFRYQDYPDYRTEKESKYLVYHIFGWPYETTACMTRLVFSGVFAKYPDLKIVCHHNGGMVPFFESRIWEQQYRKQIQKPVFAELTKAPVDYFKMFYADTEIRTVAATMCTYQFFGADHMIFGIGMPHGNSSVRSIQNTINSVVLMDISESEKQKIFMGNAIKLLRLPI